MQIADIPDNFPIPFANGAGGSYITTIPEASQIGIIDGAASLTDGFPPLNFTPIAAGGVPPFGQDMNGIFKWITQVVQWVQAGGGVPAYNATFSTAIGGYPQYSVLRSSGGTGFWVSTADDNTTDPDATDGSAADWYPLGFTGVTAVTGLTSIDVTLKPYQYANPIITLAGTLTGAVNIIVPTAAGKWTFRNDTSGAFSVTVKTAAGTGVTVAQGSSSSLYCDGVNVEDSESTKAEKGANSDITSLSAVTTLSTAAGVEVKGNPSNVAASAGYKGEYSESVVGNTNAPTTTQFGDLTSRTLTAGRWMVSGFIVGSLNGATCTAVAGGIGTATGNSSTGLVTGDTYATAAAPTATNQALIAIPPKEYLLSATTTIYLKMYADYSAGTPQFFGRLSAVRV